MTLSIGQKSRTARYAILTLVAVLGCSCQRVDSKSYQILQRTEVTALDMESGETIEGHIRAGTVIRTQTIQAVRPDTPESEIRPRTFAMLKERQVFSTNLEGE